MVVVPVCDKCGEPHVTKDGKPSCIRHSVGRLRPEIAGKPCRTPAMKGQKVCKNHGGATRQARARAEVTLQQAKLTTLAASLTDAVPGEDQDPGEIIIESIRVRYRLAAFFWSRVCALEPKALVWGKTREKIGGDDGGITFEPKAHAWFVLWRECRAELDKLCLEAVRVGLEERRVRLAEQDADTWVRFLDSLLTDLGHDPNDPQTAEVVQRNLSLVS